MDICLRRLESALMPSCHPQHSPTVPQHPHPRDRTSFLTIRPKAGRWNEYQQQEDPLSDPAKHPHPAGPSCGHGCPWRHQREADKKPVATA